MKFKKNLRFITASRILLFPASQINLLFTSLSNVQSSDKKIFVSSYSAVSSAIAWESVQKVIFESVWERKLQSTVLWAQRGWKGTPEIQKRENTFTWEVKSINFQVYF